MRDPLWRACSVLAAALVTVSCSGGREASVPAPPPDFHPVLPMKELMTHVIQHAANGVWRRQGRHYSLEGETSLFPQDPAGWEEAEEASAVLAELTNVLLISGRTRDDGKWVALVDNLRNAATASMAAAENHAEEPFFAAGSRIQEACEACHEHYLHLREAR